MAGSRTANVMRAIRERIERGRLSSHDRLPSVRRLAETMKVSPSTVVEAYDRLVAEGLVIARPGSGFFVARAPASAPLTANPRRADRAIDPFWVSRQSLDDASHGGNPGCGWLPGEWMPEEAIRRALRTIAKGPGATLTDYAPTRGSAALRDLLARRFATEGLDIGPDRIVLTDSGTEAIDLVCRLLLAPGDTVLIDDPCYFNFRALLDVHRVEVVGVPMTPEGPDLERFATAAATHRPRLYLTNSALHNPTGATRIPANAHRLLTLAAGHGMMVVEDDIFADFEPEPSPRLAVLDGLAHVIRIGSFSKTLSAAVRCGYIAAPENWIEALVELQVATRFSGASPLSAELALAVLAGGTYRKHMEALHRRLARARRDAAERLGDLGISPWIMPRGGFTLWCRLPEGQIAGDLAKAAMRRGLLLAPGEVFSVSGGGSEFMRFNVAQMGEPKIYEGLRELLSE